MKILAFGTSSSSKSINQKISIYAANQFSGAEIEILDLQNYNLPIYSEDTQASIGIPQEINELISKIENIDLLILSLTEHNGTYTTVFKNIFDWASVTKAATFDKTKMLLFSTSPGPRGGLGVMEAAKIRFPFHGAEILDSLCIPFYAKSFDPAKGFIDEEIKNKFDEIINNTKVLFSFS